MHTNSRQKQNEQKITYLLCVCGDMLQCFIAFVPFAASIFYARYNIKTDFKMFDCDSTAKLNIHIAFLLLNIFARFADDVQMYS